MNQPRRNAQAGGVFLFVCPIVGLMYGVGRGNPILWLLIGFGVGVAIALAVWLNDRRKDPR